ncbi:DUF58 domain-containing protein [Halobaculum sp. MBLA0147]|uniref:DUF58 domain-containing protein n=1 Tax=Halobaculum sp. MBLA0147 TaxID=3079934 RepID=UPI003524E806
MSDERASSEGSAGERDGGGSADGERRDEETNGGRPDGETDDETPRVGPASVVDRASATGRWTVWLGGALGLVGLGLLYGSALVIAAAAVPLAYVGYGAISALPRTVDVRVERRVPERQVTPGDHVPVTVTVHNEGQSVLPDVRVLDGVPEELAVVDGSPRVATALRPGGSTEVTYEVVAKRGSYDFEPARVRVRSLAGTAAASLSVPVAGADEISCTAPAATVPIDRAAPRRVGQSPADTGGEGLEFYATREYRRGDPQSRVNWRQFAKRGELVTTEFREERAGRAVVVLDVRPPTRRSATAAYPTGAEFAAYTAEVALERLRADGDEVALAVLGLDPDEVSVPVPTAGDALWIEHAEAGDGQRRARATLAAAAEVAAERRGTLDEGPRYRTDTPRGTESAAASLVARCPADAHVVLVSPFPDAVPGAYARRFAVADYAVSAVAPDHTSEETLGGRTVALHRRLRLREVEPLCRTVVDWPADRPLGLAVARGLAGGSKRGRSDSTGVRDADSAASEDGRDPPGILDRLWGSGSRTGSERESERGDAATDGGERQ